jgi:hypothetical protein
MAYLIYLKNTQEPIGSLYRIAENENDLNQLNINKSDYTIIEISQENFLGIKNNVRYAILDTKNQQVTYDFKQDIFFTKEDLKNRLNELKNLIKLFLDNNKNHSSFDKWNNYYNQLNSFNLDNITYPLNNSLEKYFNDLGQLSLNPLQLP